MRSIHPRASPGSFTLKRLFPLRQGLNVKSFLPLLVVLIALAFPARAAEGSEAKKRFVLYAQFLEDTPVELSDGAQWVMDKGDCFPIYMFKEQQTKVVLQLASATFWTDAKKVRVMKSSEEATALESYRKNVDGYLKSQAKKWRDKAGKE